MEQDYGSVEYEGKTLTITQLPYVDGINDEEAFYTATAEDEEGNDYQVTWPDVDVEVEDESECCDWNIYWVQEL